MTRRSQVVRSSRSNGPSAQRAFPGGATIWCTADPCNYGGDDNRMLASLPVVAEGPFQRFFASATINDVRSWWPATGDPDIVFVQLRPGPFAVVKQAAPEFKDDRGIYAPASVAITGAIDLPAGEHQIELWIGAETYGNWWSEDGYTLQVIEGQILTEPNCVPNNPN